MEFLATVIIQEDDTNKLGAETVQSIPTSVSAVLEFWQGRGGEGRGGEGETRRFRNGIGICKGFASLCEEDKLVAHRVTDHSLLTLEH